MRTAKVQLGLIVAGVVVLVGLRFLRPRMDTIEYQGQVFRLSKSYTDYEAYKDDPDNLAPGQEAALEKAVTGAPLPPTYSSREAQVRGTFALQFPGYGLSSFGELVQADGTSLTGVSVEVPRVGKERVVVYRLKDGVYTLVDDFLKASDPQVARVTLDGADLVYDDLQGNAVVTRPLKAGP